MSNFAAAFKAEIGRLARKELRGATEALKKALTAQCAEIASLKRQVADLQKQVKASGTGRSASRGRTQAAPAAAEEVEATGLRFRAAGMASNRKRLGLSAEDFGLLVGATGQSVYAWEQGKANPRAKNLAAIASLRGAGKREVYARLEALKSTLG